MSVKCKESSSSDYCEVCGNHDGEAICPAHKPAPTEGGADGTSEWLPVRDFICEMLRSSSLNDDKIVELAKILQGFDDHLSIAAVLLQIRNVAYSVGYKHGGKDANVCPGA